ncbi:unnamed protein product [Cyprideis torosa]|uniref:Uncharacterized protein n=1 Tax=Cyprideis torosa TaxID=163714 RepID=A0A7R8W9Y6_9CRUS|nr:unnamed protein product [Cyprideis torosa]CAG0890290.1 unnamed protein product [Cyprideis torosa]
MLARNNDRRTSIKKKLKVKDASEKLHELGYTKRDTPIGCRSQVTKAGAQPPKKEKKKAKKKFLDGEEKKAIKSNFQVKYRDISCTVLNMALESCHYDCERTEKILNDVKNEMRELELKRAESRQEALLKEELPMASPKHKSPRLPRKSPKRHPVTASPLRTTSVAPSPQKVAPSPSKRGSSGSSVAAEPKASSTDHAKPAYVSKLTRPPLGPNPELRKGPCDGLLLHQYLVWSGPNEELRGGPNKSLHKGPAGLAKGSMGAKGPNASLARGPNAANCRGSIYRDLIMSQRKFSSPLLCSNSGTASTDENSEGGNSALPGEDSSPTPATTTTNRLFSSPNQEYHQSVFSLPNVPEVPFLSVEGESESTVAWLAASLRSRRKEQVPIYHRCSHKQAGSNQSFKAGEYRSSPGIFFSPFKSRHDGFLPAVFRAADDTMFDPQSSYSPQNSYSQSYDYSNYYGPPYQNYPKADSWAAHYPNSPYAPAPYTDPYPIIQDKYADGYSSYDSYDSYKRASEDQLDDVSGVVTRKDSVSQEFTSENQDMPLRLQLFLSLKQLASELYP